jgi:hypothetical protein
MTSHEIHVRWMGTAWQHMKHHESMQAEQNDQKKWNKIRARSDFSTQW